MDSLNVDYKFKRESKKNDFSFKNFKNEKENDSDDFSEDLWAINFNKYSENIPGSNGIDKINKEEKMDFKIDNKLTEEISGRIKKSKRPKIPFGPAKSSSLFSKSENIEFKEKDPNANPFSLIPPAEKKNTIDSNRTEKNSNVPHKNNSGSFGCHTPIPSTIQLDCEEVDVIKLKKESKLHTFYKDSLCEAFFVAGLPFKKARVIPDSENYIAACKHKICSILPAYKPDILKRIVIGEDLQDTPELTSPSFHSSHHHFSRSQKILSKFEMTQATANLCFPQGIKICYHQKIEEIHPYKTFTTITTNEAGKRHYITVFHFFQKMTLPKFKSLYDFDPVTDHNRYNKEVQFLIDKLTNIGNSTSASYKKDIAKFEHKYEENHLLCCNLISSDYVFLPKCACLVSKLPYTKQMEQSIETLIKMTIDSNITNDDINKLLLHLIYELPIPPPNKKILYYLPYQISPVEIKGRLYKDLPITSCNVAVLFEFFTPEMIFTVHQLILLEQKILFVYDDYTKLSEVSQAFITLMYPMQWINTYIPILSEEMLKYLKSFMPFIMGVDSTLFDFFVKTDEFDEENNVYIIPLGRKSTIESSSAFSNLKRKKTTSKQMIKSLSHMPDEIQKSTIKNLEELVKLEKENSNFCKRNTMSNTNTFTLKDSPKFEKKIKNVFIKSMVLLFGDYKKYVSFIDDCNYFNAESFISSRSENFKQFYSDLTQTGVFRHFLNNKQEIGFPYFDKMCIRLMNSILSRNSTLRSFSKSILNSDTKLKTKSFIRSSSNNRMISTVSTQNKEGTGKKELSNNTTHSKSINQDLNKTPDIKPSLGSLFSISVEGHSDSYNENKSTEFNETYCVAPCFINNSMKSVISFEEMIAEKFKYAISNPDCLINKVFESRIFSEDFQKEFDFSKMPHVFKNYFLPGQENTLSQFMGSDKSFKSNRTSTQQQILDENEIKALEKTKEIINDFLKMIITADHYTHIDSSTSNSALSNKYGRHYFSKVLFQSKFKENKSQILSDKGFTDLFYMIFNCLIVSDNEASQFDDIKRVTKSCFFYYKLFKGKDQYFIYQEIVRKNPIPFAIWINEEFWLRWFQDEIEQRPNTFQEVEDFYFFILSEIATIMNNLNIELKIILKCIIEKIALTFITADPTLIKDLEKSITKQYTYLSKVKEF